MTLDNDELWKTTMEITVKGPFTVISHGMRWIKIRKSGSVYCMWINKIGGIVGDLSYCVAAYTLGIRSNTVT